MVQGALLLTNEGAQIETMLRAERLQIVQMSILSLAVSIILSFMVSGAIVRPIRRLARAASETRGRLAQRPVIPTFRGAGEVGELAEALARMTDSLYARLDAIESFAADVAHEIKNPLTSLRSAVETLQQTEDAPRRAKLLSIIKDDVRRIDRLITDIAAASRLDAELAREEMRPVDLARLLRELAALASEHGAGVPVELALDAGALDGAPFVLPGLEERLGQVFRNLIDNAQSFSPQAARVRLIVKLDPDQLIVAVDDEGPGIPPESLEKIFARFYTSRDDAPDGKESFGQHSGLGLAIARQIVLAHGGTIRAENRVDAAGQVVGARFTVRLPR
jgi:two-component system sensor histidine kinase ChvG